MKKIVTLFAVFGMFYQQKFVFADEEQISKTAIVTALALVGGVAWLRYKTPKCCACGHTFVAKETPLYRSDCLTHYYCKKCIETNLPCWGCRQDAKRKKEREKKERERIKAQNKKLNDDLKKIKQDVLPTLLFPSDSSSNRSFYPVLENTVITDEELIFFSEKQKQEYYTALRPCCPYCLRPRFQKKDGSLFDFKNEPKSLTTLLCCECIVHTECLKERALEACKNHAFPFCPSCSLVFTIDDYLEPEFQLP